jgi:hypothetical protein
MANKPFFDMNKDELLQWVVVPRELEQMAREEPYRFMRDVVALPTKAVTPFMTDYSKIEAACTRGGLIDVFNKDKLCFHEQWRCPFDDNFNRYIHVDLARTRDAAALAMAHAASFIEVEFEGKRGFEPVIEIDCIVRITAPQGGEISHGLFIDLIEDLSSRGFRIRLITFDKWNSTMPIQILRDKGYISEVLSIDKTDYIVKVDPSATFRIRHESTQKNISHAYQLLKHYIMSGHLSLPFNKHFIEECKSLEEDGETKKVFVPTKLPDDVVQVVTGAITNLWHNEHYIDIGDNYTTMDAEILDRINSDKSFRRDISGIDDPIYSAINYET